MVTPAREANKIDSSSMAVTFWPCLRDAGLRTDAEPAGKEPPGRADQNYRCAGHHQELGAKKGVSGESHILSDTGFNGLRKVI